MKRKQVKRQMFSAIDERMPSEKKLALTLSKIEKRTQLVPIASVGDVTIYPNGRLGSGFRLSSIAIRQFCAHLCRGLSITLGDLGSFGSLSPTTDPALLLDPEEVRSFFNTVIRARFAARLRGRRLVVDTHREVVDGIIGARYRPLSNREFYDQIRTKVQVSPDFKAVFHEAILAGRTLLLRYRCKEPLTFTRISREDVFYQGWEFGNSETGQLAIHGAVSAIRRADNSKATAPYRSCGKVLHVSSSNFQKRVIALIHRVFSEKLDAAFWNRRLSSLGEHTMGFGGIPSDHEKRVAEVIRRIYKRGGLPLWLAKEVVAKLLAYSQDAADQQSISTARNQFEAFAAKTGYDLLTSTMSVASRQESIEAERLVSRFAYECVTRGALF